LTPEEQELGVTLIDVGGGSTSLVVYQLGAVKHTAVLPVGGGHVTKDIAAGLRTSLADAEKLKQRHGCALARAVSADETIEVASVGGRGPRLVSRRALGEIVEPRVEEILRLAVQELARVGFEDGLTSGVVLTGGSAILEGMPALAERVFEAPVRIGMPVDVGGLVDVVNSPMYSTAVGLVLHGLHARAGGTVRGSNGRVFAHVRDRIAGWLRDFF
jgi:cell division protein FtsA